MMGPRMLPPPRGTSMPKKKKKNSGALNAFIVSDATGTTALSVFTSVQVQFPEAKFHVTRFPFVRTIKKVDEIIERAPTGKCVVILTLLEPELRERMLEGGKRKGLTVVDVMGPLLKVFPHVLRREARMEPGMLSREREEAARLAESIRFTLAHDDGIGIETMHEADLLILGASRTGKTPTSIFLSCKKLKVGNIPIIANLPFPRTPVPVRKVGLLMSPDRLLQLRMARSSRLGGIGSAADYASMRAVRRDLKYCEKVYGKLQDVVTIDVTNRSIEETAAWITRHLF